MESTGPITFTIELTSVEVSRFFKYVNYSRTWRIAAAILAFILMNLLLVADSLQHSESRHPIQDLWLPFVATVVFFGAVFYKTRRGLKEMMPGLFLPTTFTVLDEGLLSSNARGELMQCWKSAERFVETEDDFFVMFAKGTGHPFPKRCSPKLEGAASSHILPKRCFSTKEAAAIFANQVRLHVEKYAPSALAAV
ncbi:MAG TPA: YcxB family protein [Chthoniobacter sp.]|nr:YcxB family protein [Chthoniobacter sp.]